MTLTGTTLAVSDITLGITNKWQITIIDQIIGTELIFLADNERSFIDLGFTAGTENKSLIQSTSGNSTVLGAVDGTDDVTIVLIIYPNTNMI